MNSPRISVAAVLLLTAVFIRPTSAEAAASCESLTSLVLPNTTITLAEPVMSLFTPPGGRGGRPNPPLKDLPNFCRVAATLKPTADSDIKIEVWLPVSNWNGKFQAVGNGGWAGSITYDDMAEALRRGYATSSTDTGHTGANGAFALGHWEKYVDFAYRSEHEMTIQAKAIIRAYYGDAPKYSYWNSCSAGGRQALMEVQRFPGDYDGVIAGASANPRLRLNAWQLTVAQAGLMNPASVIPREKYPMIHRAVIETCDSIDGLKDGLIDDPRKCHFDPKVLTCTAGDTATCLTATQVETARKVMSPTRTKKGVEVYPGWEAGTELGWNVLLGGPEAFGAAVDQYKYIVFQDPKWDWRTFDLEKDVALAQQVDKGVVEANNPDIQAFAGRGGKLLMYHGWSDPNVAPGASVRYYESVLEKMGGAAKTSNFIRLFMGPGMGHCGGGEGPNAFDAVAALEQWVEQGKAPDRIVASHSTDGKVDRTRPLCPYPQVARHNGSGSIDDAANFTCKMP